MNPAAANMAKRPFCNSVSTRRSKADTILSDDNRSKADTVSTRTSKAHSIVTSKSKAETVASSRSKAETVASSRSKAETVASSRSKAETVASSRSKAETVLSDKANSVATNKSKAETTVRSSKSKAPSVATSKSRAEAVSGSSSVAGDASVGGGSVASRKQASVASRRSRKSVASGVSKDTRTPSVVSINRVHVDGGEHDEIVILAPAGKLGVVIDTPNVSIGPIVHAVKESSVIRELIEVGDKFIGLDDVDVRGMTAIEVSKLIAKRSKNPVRKFLVLRPRDQNASIL